MARRFFGQFNMNTNCNALLLGLIALLCCLPVHGAPEHAQLLDAEAQAASLRLAEGAWVDLEHVGERLSEKYDEQIFTEISPILDSPDAVKLPDDQLLTD